MRIKKFEITHGGYFATKHELTKVRNTLVFNQWVFGPTDEPSVIVKLTHKEWANLVTELVDLIKGWKPIYDSDICDGIQWTVVLKTNLHNFHINGSNEFPDNFDDLLTLLRDIPGLESFAE